MNKASLANTPHATTSTSEEVSMNKNHIIRLKLIGSMTKSTPSKHLHKNPSDKIPPKYYNYWVITN